MPVFLTQSQLYRLIQRELPEDVYPHAGDPSVYLSTADSASQAQLIAKVYEALEQAYDNQWPQTANEAGIEMHEVARFGKVSTGLSLSDRRLRVLAKMRTLPSMSEADLTALVRSLLLPALVTPKTFDASIDTAIASNGITPQQWPPGAYLYAYNALGNTWRLGISLLGVDTILGGGMRAPAGVDVCDLSAEDLGLTEEELLDARINAYTYEVRITDGDFEESVTDESLATVDEELSKAEPARSQHVIRTGYRTPLPVMERLASTDLHLVADDWELTGQWLDRSSAENHADYVTDLLGYTKVACRQFFERSAIFVDDGYGFIAPNDDIGPTGKRTYEVVIESMGNAGTEHIIGRYSTGGTQYANWLVKRTGPVALESSIYNTTASAPYMGGLNYTVSPPKWNLPVIIHTVIDVPNRTIDVYMNGVQLTQVDNDLFGSFGSPTGLKLGIFDRWRQASNNLENPAGFGSGTFHGGIIELLRHEEAFTEEMVVARAAEFNRLKGY